MSFRALKYTTVYTGAGCGVLSLLGEGWLVLALPLYAFALIPFLELFLKPDPRNMEAAEVELARQDSVYDWLLYSILPIQWGMMALLLFVLNFMQWTNWEIAGKIWAAGIGCGVLGINVAHELGHRTKWQSRLAARLLLLSSLYMHFFIEHNRGHHLRVSTPEDPASARKGESLYAFWIRSVVGSYFSAWHLENSRLKRKGVAWISPQNEMLVYQLLQVGLVVGIGLLLNWQSALAFVLAATIGFLLLETVNYIEHYGLQRKKSTDGTYARVEPQHSWNSDHPLGRLVLFELSRHSDHHYRSGKKYQLLRHWDHAPQMPTGYPGMMVLATIPPLWFYVMHRQLAGLESELAQEAQPT
jgi:alkane 1-monooxygenase